MAKNKPHCNLEIKELAPLRKANAAQTAEFRERYDYGLFFLRHLKEVGLGFIVFDLYSMYLKSMF